MFIAQVSQFYGKPSLFFLGVIITLFSWLVLGSFPLLIVFFYLQDEGGILNKNLLLLLLFLGFVIGLASLLLFVKGVHKIPLRRLFTARDNFDFTRMFNAFWLWGAFNILYFLADYFLFGKSYTLQLELIPFLILVLISLFLLPIQVLFEELFFRGYLLQGVAKLTGSRVAPFLVSSIGFGLFHSFNEEVSNIGIAVMAIYIGTGILLTAITMLDDGLEISIGIHISNNLLTLLLVSSSWASFQTDAIFYSEDKPGILEMFLMVFLLYPFFFFTLAKKYGWKHWRQKLFGSLESESNTV